MNLTSREALRMFDVADIWATRTGNRVRLVSANDHVHNWRSAHYDGLALDFHSSNPDGLAAVFRRMGYRVLWRVRGHYSHVHVEHDADRGVSPIWRDLAPETRQASGGGRRSGTPADNGQARTLTAAAKPPA